MSTRTSTTTLVRRESGSNGRVQQQQQTDHRQSQSIVHSSSSSTTTSTSATTSLMTQSLSNTPYFANRKTGQQLTLTEAIQTGLLDLQRGAYIDPVTGNVLTLSEAASQGLVDPTAASALLQPSLGLRDPRTGQGISLMQAIQLGLYDPGRGGFVHPQTGEPVTAEEALLAGLLLRDKVSTLVALGVVRTGPPSLVEALQLGWVDYDTAFVTVPQKGVRCSLHEAVVSGLVSVDVRRRAVHLYDALRQGLIDPQSRMFSDRSQRASVSEAVERRLIDVDVASVVDQNGRRITLAQAIDCGLVDPVRCTFKMDATKSVSWDVAVRERRIVKPLTLKECVDQQLVNADGTIIDPLSAPQRPVSWNLLRAAKAGLLDVDSTKSVADSQSGRFLTLAEALSEGIINPSGVYVERSNGTTLTLEEASEMGLLLTDASASAPPRRSSTGSENDPPPTGWPLKVAIERKYLDTNSGLFAVPGTDRLVSLEECIRLNIIRQDSATVLDPSTNHYIPILRAFEKRILTQTGHFKESSGKTLTIREALNRYVIIFVDDDNVSPSSPIKRGYSPSRARQVSVERDGPPAKMKPLASPAPLRREISRNKSIDAGNPWDGLAPPDLQDIRVATGVYFSPASGIVSVDETGETLNLLEALKKNVVQPGKVKVRDPASVTKELSIAEAIRKGIVSKETGEYKFSGGRTLSLLDAIQVGVIYVIGRPASEPEAVVEVESSPQSWKDIRIKLVDPLTGAEVTWESALERHILDSEVVLQFARKTQQPALTAELLSCIVLSDAITGKQMPVSEGLDCGIVSENRIVELIQEQKPVPYRLMDLSGIPLDGKDHRKMSLADQTRSKITTEPKFSVAIGRARSAQIEPSKLQRIRRKVMKPREAALRGLVDEQTADLLDLHSGSVESFMKKQKFDLETTGAISDILRGQQLTFREALERGLLDNETGEMQFPVASSVSVSEAVERGLFDQRSGYFVHPENGSSLTLSEAIECEIIDPQTQVVDTRIEEHKSFALSLAITIGLVDGQSGDVETERGAVPLIEAVSRHQLYLPSPRIWSPQVPPVGLTLPVVLDRKLIDASSMEMIHPSNGRRIPLEEAIHNNLILAIPYPVAPDYIQLIRAIEKRMLDVDRQTFTDMSGRKMSVVEALERGVLVIKRPVMYHSSTVSSAETNRVVETLISTETLVTSVIHLVSGYSLIGKNHVKNERTGRIITLEHAERIGLVIGVQADQLSFQEAVTEGFIHLPSGTFTRPGTHERMSLNLALQEGWIKLDGFDDVPVRLNSSSHEIRADTLIYDCRSQQMITVQQAIHSGLLNRNGEYLQSGSPVPLAEAIRLGLVAVLGDAIVSDEESSLPVLFTLSSDNKETVENGHIFHSRRTSIRNALKEERIAGQVQLLFRKSRMSIDEALSRNVATPTAIISIEEDDQVHFVGEPQLRLSAVDMLDREFAVEQGFFDPDQEVFVDNETGDPVRVADATALGILDGQEIVVKDLRCNSTVTLDEAVESQLVDPITGHMIDHKTGRKISFYEAVQLNWIEASPAAHRALLGSPIAFKHAVAQGWYAVESGLVSIPTLKKPIHLAVAIRHQYIDADSIIYRSFPTGEDLTLTQAAQREWVDQHAGTVKQREEAKPIDYTKAVQQGLLQPKRQPVSLEATIRNGTLDASSGKLTEPVGHKQLTVEESVKWGLIDAFISEIHDTKRQKVVSLEEAIETRLIDSAKGRLMNTATGQWLDFVSALKQGLIGTHTTTRTIFDAVEDGLYEPETGEFCNPFTGGQETLREAIDSGLVDGSSARVQQDDGSFISLEEAAISGLLDGRRLDEAIEEKMIVPLHKAWSLQEAISHKLYERETGLFAFAGMEKVTLQTAIQKGLIKKSALTVKDPRSSDIVSLAEAIQTGIIDPTSGMAIDPSTGAEMDFVTAMERGLIIGAQRKLSVTEALLKGMYCMQSGRFSTPSDSRKRKLRTDVAIRSGVIESKANLVRNYKTGRIVTFEQAVHEQLIDVKQGTLRISPSQTIDFQQALDRGLLVEVQRPLFLSESMLKEVYDEQTGLFLDPVTGEWLTLAEAIESGLIDPESVHLKDTRYGFLRKISLSVAIELGMVDGQTTKVSDLSSRKEYTLAEAFANGLIVDSKAPVSIQRMIQQGMYDETNGRVTDPNSGRQVTIHEALRRCILHPLLPCFYDRQSGRLLNLVETCRNGIINRRTGQFRLVQSKLEMPLNVALEREFILDIEHAFSLYDAIHVGFFDKHRNCFVHPTNGRHLNLDAACKEALIQPAKSIVKHSKTGRYMKLDEAITIGLIDPERNVYCPPGSSPLTLPEALEHCFIVTSRSGLTLEEAIRNGLYAHETGKFVDPSVGDLLDLNQAMEHGLIDGSTTALKDMATGSLKSLKSAIEDGDVDVVRGRVVESRSKRSMNLETALEQGMIVTVERALTFDQAVRTGAIDLNMGTFIDPRTSCQCTLEEAIRQELIDPQSAVIKNPRTGRFISLKRAVVEGIVDMRKRAIMDPLTGYLLPLCIIFEQGTVVFHRQSLGFDEAIERGQFNLKMARLTEPASLEELNLKQAVALGCLNSDSVLVRDSLHKQFLKLSAAFEVALIDADQGLVLDNSNGKQVSLAEALEMGLIITPKRQLSLIEAIEFGLYDLETGRFTDPFNKRSLTLSEAAESCVVDLSSNLAKDPQTGRIVSLFEAIEEGLLDATAGRLANMNLVEALAKGYLLTAHARVSLARFRFLSLWLARNNPLFVSLISTIMPFYLFNVHDSVFFLNKIQFVPVRRLTSIWFLCQPSFML